MIVYEFRVTINGNVINHKTMYVNCSETEYLYIPNDEDDIKAYYVVQPYKKNLLEKPLRNRMFYFIYTDVENNLYDCKNKLLEYINHDYEKQKWELEKQLKNTKEIMDNIWSIN